MSIIYSASENSNRYKTQKSSFFKDYFQIDGISVGDKISSGGQGNLYRGFHIQKQQIVAIKTSKSNLEQEYKILLKLSNIKGIQQVFNFQKCGGLYCLIFELLQQDLGQLQRKQKGFSLKTILSIAIQILEILKLVHSQKIIHRDIKPTNLMIKNLKSDQIFLIDFGIAIDFQQNLCNYILPGSLIYDSIQSLKGQQLRYIDDIEMLGYTLTSFYKTLSWCQTADMLNNPNQILKLKEEFLLSKEMQDLPFSALFRYVKCNQNNNIPNHDYLIIEMKKVLESNGILYDGQFDWNSPSLPLYFSPLLLKQSTLSSKQENTHQPKQLKFRNAQTDTSFEDEEIGVQFLLKRQSFKFIQTDI